MRIPFLYAAVLLTISLGCNKQPNGPKALRVGVTPVPAGEVIAEVVPMLAKQGIELEIVSFSDYIQPNMALAANELDANLYQNVPFMENFNRERGTQFVSVVKVYLPPMGIYPGRTQSLSDLPANALVAIPNDPINAGRSLLLLQSAGLLALKPSAGVATTLQDIIANPKSLRIQEVEAAQLPRSLPDVNVAVINANFALDAGLSPVKDTLYREADASTYANVLVVNESKKSDPRVMALARSLTSPEIKSFIQSRYKGAVRPVF